MSFRSLCLSTSSRGAVAASILHPGAFLTVVDCSEPATLRDCPLRETETMAACGAAARHGPSSVYPIDTVPITASKPSHWGGPVCTSRNRPGWAQRNRGRASMPRQRPALSSSGVGQILSGWVPRSWEQRLDVAASGSAGDGGGGSGDGPGGEGQGGDSGDDEGPARRPVLARYPDWSAGGILRLLDWLGTALFGITGSITATASGLDMLGATLVGVVTAIGGGTIRDIIIGNRAVFWLAGEFEYFLIAAVAAASTRLLGPSVTDRWTSGSSMAKAFQWVMKWGDAMAVGTFAIIGAHNGLRLASPWPACLLFGMMTATFGGAVRDVICRRPVRILHSNQDMYATTALASAGAYTAATRLCLPPTVRVVSGLGVAVAGRYLATSRDPQVLKHLMP